MKVVIIAAVALLLVGCQNPYAGYKDEWLEFCMVVPPPDGDTYKAATYKQRTIMLAQAINAQQEENMMCNTRIKAARAYLNEVKGK